MPLRSESLTFDIISLWKDFTFTGKLEDPIKVRPEILDSWKRCREAGVDHNDGTSYRLLDPSQIKEMLDQHRELVDIAKPFMDRIYNFVKGSGFIVMLTDERGYIMEAFGDQDTLQKASRLNFIRGACWTEEDVGTNAIGTALVLRKPIQVSGAEHYCRKHHAWTCSAAPIIDKSGQMIGILDLSGPSYGTHLHTLGMVVAAVEAIIDQMSIRNKNRELSLANKCLSNIIHTMSDGVMIVDKQSIIAQLNPAAENILGESYRGRSW